MVTPIETFRLLKGALTDEDLTYLKAACRSYIDAENSIPSYVLLDKRSSPVFQKIKRQVERAAGQELLYLNDFYLYSDSNFGANWHMDTELFTFKHCLNAWMLLSPGEIESPLGIISDINDTPENFYHSMKTEGEAYSFFNYRSGGKVTKSREAIEAGKVSAPHVTAGDILILNPKKFHKTNTTVPKHAIIIKFVANDASGVLSDAQVPAMFWSETSLFNTLVKSAADWEDVLTSLRQKLDTPEGRKVLSAGFFPEKIELYREMVRTL